MPTVYLRTAHTADSTLLLNMYADRKAVFIDHLKWPITTLEGRYEKDQFDTDDAEYIIVTDENGRHLASSRILPTTRPHILGSIFPHLCAGGVTIGSEVFEITRFCITPALGAKRTRYVRNRLVSAIAEYGVQRGVMMYTGVAEFRWFSQIRRFGWDCSTLSSLSAPSPRELVGLSIRINDLTLDRLREAGIYTPDILTVAAPVKEVA